ncbi:hypothetical protein, partial [Bacillus cereus]
TKQKETVNTLSISERDIEIEKGKVGENLKEKTKQLELAKKEIDEKYGREVFLYEWEHEEELNRFKQSKEQLGEANKALVTKKELL